MASVMLSPPSSPLSSLTSSSGPDEDDEDMTVALSPRSSAPVSNSPFRATDLEVDSATADGGERDRKRPRLSTPLVDLPKMLSAEDLRGPPTSPLVPRDATRRDVDDASETESTNIPRARPVTAVAGSIQMTPIGIHRGVPAASGSSETVSFTHPVASTSTYQPALAPFADHNESPRFHLASQELRQLQQEIGSQDFDDWMPSSQAGPSSPAFGPSLRKRASLMIGNEANGDDSGIFIMDAEKLEGGDDPDFAVGGEEERIGREDLLETEEVGDAGEDAQEPLEEYEGDDMWDIAKLDELDGDLGLTSKLDKGKGRALEQPREEDEDVYAPGDQGDPTEQLLGFGFANAALGFHSAAGNDTVAKGGAIAAGTFMFRSKAIPMAISEDELKRSRALLEADDDYDDDEDNDDDVDGQVLAGRERKKRPVNSVARELPTFVPPMRTVNKDSLAHTPLVTRPGLASMSSQLVGDAIFPPSSSHREASQAPSAASVDVFASNVQAGAPVAGLFATANGRPIEQPPQDALAKARATIALSPPPSRPSSRTKQRFDVDTPTKDARRSPLLALDNTLPDALAPPTSSLATTEVALPPVVPVSMLPVTQTDSSTPQRARSNATPGPAQPASAFRPPFAAGLSTSLATPSSKKPVPAMRRLNLGMTPRARTGVNGSPVPKFTTPFKNGKRPEGLTASGLPGSLNRNSIEAKSSTRTVVRVSKANVTMATPRKINARAVFDLEGRSEQRKSLREFGLHPGTVDEVALRYLGVPEEVIEMDSTSASKFVFPGNLGAPQAFETLVAENCSLATIEWVMNHWSLIVWKLAAYVRADPAMLKKPEWWSFVAVTIQLKYRYEREINCAQRSCVKRIQEQDSSSSLPMILCVSDVRYGDRSSYEDNRIRYSPLVSKEATGLELTDGWYRIRANVDATLKHALERGKLKIGSKLAIAGAKLDAPREGTDVLEAIGVSSLIISGNSTSLARWDARLGFTFLPFIAALDSLSSQGGVVSMVDLVVERVFPRGFIDGRRGVGSEPWDEAEEQRRQEEWIAGSKKARTTLANDLDKDDSLWEEIAELLREEVESGDGEGISDEAASCDDPKAVLDRLEAAPTTSKRAALSRQLSSKSAKLCLLHLNDVASRAKGAAVSDIQRELKDKYPERNVRSFRVVRVKDARISEGKLQRTAQLTVWEPETLGTGFLREGRRYMVTNLMPKGNWGLRSTEIALATRKDSKWKRVDEQGRTLKGEAVE